MMENEMSNKIKIGDRTFTIRPIKMKYMKDGFYTYYISIKKIGFMKMLCYDDGMTIVKGFLEGVFDNNELDINYMLEELVTQKEKELLDKVKIINEIEDEEDLKNE